MDEEDWYLSMPFPTRIEIDMIATLLRMGSPENYYTLNHFLNTVNKRLKHIRGYSHELNELFCPETDNGTPTQKHYG